MEVDDSAIAGGFLSGHVFRWDLRPGNNFGTRIKRWKFPSGIRSLICRNNRDLIAGLTDSRLVNIQIDGNRKGDVDYVPGHSDWVLGIDVVPNKAGNGLLTVSKDGAVRQWSATSLGQLFELEEEPGSGQNLSWQQKTLMIRERDAIQLHEMPSGKRIGHLKSDSSTGLNTWTMLGRDNAYGLLDFLEKQSSNEKPGFGRVDFHNPNKLQVRWRIQNEGAIPHCGTITQDGQLVCLAIDDDLLALNVDTGVQQWIQRHPQRVEAVALNPEGGQVITTCQDGQVRFWDRETGTLSKSQSIHRDGAQQLAVSPLGVLLATSGNDLLVRVWELRSMREIATFNTQTELKALCFLDRTRTLVGQETQHLVFWSVPEQVEVVRLPLHADSRIAISPDQSMIAIQTR
ncbi:MAG: hypothetical protein FJ267_16790, partial [Planctomycetes bacterium]|nr:hypothetical protein [Planctomycetota bacterium]